MAYKEAYRGEDLEVLSELRRISAEFAAPSPNFLQRSVQAITVAGTSITPEANVLKLSATAPQNLETISYREGVALLLLAKDGNVTLKHNVGNLLLKAGVDKTLSANDVVALIALDDKWFEY